MSATTDVPAASASPGRPAVRATPLLAALARSRVQSGLAFAVYLGFAIFITWPFVLHPGTTLYGIVGGDLTASVAQFQQVANAHQPPFLPGTIHSVNAPDGLPTDWALSLAGFGSSLSLWLMSMAFGAVAAHGIMALSGFALSAFAMFLLVRRVTGNPGIAFAVGIAYGFWPFQYVTGWTWPHYTQGWVFVVLLWRMLEATERPTLRNGLLAGAAAVLAMTWIQYNLLIAGVLYGTLVVLALVRARVTGTLRAQVLAQAAGATIVVAAVAVVAIAAATSNFTGLPTRPADDAVANSARPLMYVVPGPRSLLFRHTTGHWIETKYAGPLSKQHSSAGYAEIYQGISVILVALIGAFWTLARARRLRWATLRDPLAALGVTAIVVGLVAFAFSAPPHVAIAGVSVPMPYALVNHLTTVFRVAHRFAELTMLALCVLAGIGLVAVLRGRSLRLQAALLAPLAVVFAVDLWARPIKQVTTVIRPPSYYTVLKHQPPGIVAEYPLNNADIALNTESLYQPYHGHPMFSGFPRGSDSEIRKTQLEYLLDKQTVPALAAYGVRYVLVHKPDPGAPKIIPRPRQRIAGLQDIGGDSSAELYRVVARPATTSVFVARGFNGIEGARPGQVSWLAQNGGHLEIKAPCSPCVGSVDFGTGTFARPRTLTIRDPSGRVLFRRLIKTSAEHATVRLRFSRATVLYLSTDPPPDQVNKFVPGIDTRHFGVFVSLPVRLRVHQG